MITITRNVEQYYFIFFVSAQNNVIDGERVIQKGKARAHQSTLGV